MKFMKLMMNDVKFMFYLLALKLGMWKWWNCVVDMSKAMFDYVKLLLLRLMMKMGFEMIRFEW